ncbi:prephenate dehydrogenase/arogenate dehydrogenase family protein [Nordella sp. HKS 07]|uniref:prephenate dehydrogenase/arogenate dehydrogenase family protein n=1 Tax=Nordella sp. HKS 07 TaxID=2712222 RepID=UPI0013E1A996|nr:prephenate dehydrogenase/arogenate dehydrogenase family protein [Nordella sp. HKS 07]QIG46383.1 prephenate dehydrogenase/arogenate dehydrogenase family protein [Nordella sp. HKS 07]
MPALQDASHRPHRRLSLGLIGFGAFGRLAACHLSPHFALHVFDPAFAGSAGLAETAGCQIVVIAVPVARMADTIRAIAPHVRPGALVLDVGSVKVEPARLMRELLPPYVDIVATHPLFGPQSARSGVRGLKIALCPVRGRSHRRVAAFLQIALGLKVVTTTPDVHDRDAALSQGLTHLIAKVLVKMEPLPDLITTRSFDLLYEAVEMVRHDPPELFDAIERLNPYALEVRRRFFDLASALDADLHQSPVELRRPPLARRSGDLRALSGVSGNISPPPA